MRITKLALQNWRNIKNVNVPLRRRVFLVGPNASGKSNFLDAFRFLRDIASSGGGLEKAVESRGGVAKVRSVYARQKPNVLIEVELGDESASPEWSYHLEFTQNKNKRPVVKKEIVKRNGDILLARSAEDEADDPELSTQTHMEQASVNKGFRSISEYFRSIQYQHMVPQLVRDPERSGGKKNDPFGGDFLERLAKFQSAHEAEFKKRFEKINDALNVAVPQLRNLKLEDFNGHPHLRGQFEHWRPSGAWQEENDFSDGTLRLLGLLWAILDTQGVLLLEEPELSLHPSVVRHIPQMFARVITKKKQGVQIILSTHSEDIFSDLGIDPREILILIPSQEGSDVKPVSNMEKIKVLLDSGLSIADFISSLTSPRDAIRLTEFG